ncbi:PREDICTED: putative FBD-associated F-box protein At1g05080 [Camelina sativa]|uniref:FBD-associated F-box protein At1g05080 n=1 Tax=Camelina sativa TaxID=90675 RepID=A0ABM0T889_CAMSA|nr:PREDICTED: putative FBD-associated F-box protein At1g05080 [Camelina sativa]
MECHYCHKKGHLKKDCWKLKRDNKQQGKQEEVDRVIYCGHTTKDLPLTWIQPSSVPRCVSSQLKDFEWNGYVGREEEEQVLTYVLANSNCLKLATITLSLLTCEFESDFELAKKMTMDRLKDIPRVLTESQLITTRN